MEELSSTSPQADLFVTYSATASAALETDDELVEQIERRNRRAFEVLCKRHHPQALGLAAKILENQTLAEQVVQEAFWWVWKYPFLARNRSAGFSDWFYGIVQHAATTEMNRRLDCEVPNASHELARYVAQRENSNGDEPR